MLTFEIIHYYSFYIIVCTFKYMKKVKDTNIGLSQIKYCFCSFIIVKQEPQKL